jgi:hypothetical protein
VPEANKCIFAAEFVDTPVPVNPELEIGSHRMPAGIHQNQFSKTFISFKKYLERLEMHFKLTCSILKNMLHIPVKIPVCTGILYIIFSSY